MMASVFIAGATGYMGSRLVGQLVDHGHQVKALSRRPVDLPCDLVHGDALDASTYAENVVGCSSFVHLVGTPHPAPWKEEQFRAVDLASLKQSVRAAKLGDFPFRVRERGAPRARDESLCSRPHGRRGDHS